MASDSTLVLWPASSRAGNLTLVFWLLNYSTYLHQSAFKIVPGSLIWPQPFCHWSCCSLLWPPSPRCGISLGSGQAGYVELLACPPPHINAREGNATFWRLSTLSDNSAFSLKDSTGKLQTFKTNLVFIQLCNHFYVLSVFHTPWNGATLCNWISCTVTQRH